MTLPPLEHIHDGRKGRTWPGVEWVVTGPDDQNGGAVAACPSEVLPLEGDHRNPKHIDPVFGGLCYSYMRLAAHKALALALEDVQKWTPEEWSIELTKGEVWVDE